MVECWQFGTRPDGQTVSAFKLTSSAGFEAVILDQGAILQSLRLPNGRNVVVGFEDWDSYETDTNYIGRIIGPNANRIANAQFQIGKDIFELMANDGPNNLHSGPDGFDTQMWATTEAKGELRLTLHSPAGTSGFPGETLTSLGISLTQNRLKLSIQARANVAMPMNITWHPYWNLGTNSRIDNHDFMINAEHHTKMDQKHPLIIEGTRHDFRQGHPLGSVQLDSNYKDVKTAQLTAGRTALTVTSSLPDMQIYTGDALPHPRSGIALEPQFQPNDINLAQHSLLKAGESYSHWIEYRFDDV